MLRRVLRKLLWTVSAIPYLPTRGNSNVTVVTAADASHAKSLYQLLQSVVKYLPGCSIICFDLGMTNDQRSRINSLLRLSGHEELRLFPFQDYPPYFDIRINAGEYAWKPVIVDEVVKAKPNSLTIWFDAGNVVTNRLYWLIKIATREGFFSPWSSGSIADWTHSGQLNFLNFPRSLMQKRNLNAAIVLINGLDQNSRRTISSWRDCAECHDCIAPLGSSRSNHRQDQSALTLLAYQNRRVRPIFHRFLGELWEPFGVRTHCDID